MVSVTFRHMDPSDALKQHATERLERLKKYMVDAADAHVVLGVEKLSHHADILVKYRGVTMRSKEHSSDMYNSIDRAVEKIEKQFNRYRERIKNHKPREGSPKKYRVNIFEEANQEAGNTANDKIVETKEFDIRAMTVDEAIMHMDLLHNDIFVFLNPQTNETNVLYRKKGSKFGLIEAHPS